VAESAQDVLAYIEWVWFLQWRSELDLDPGDASWDEIAASIGVEAPKLVPGDLLPDELGTAQLYWPLIRPRQDSIRLV
jgi:hypothetical protein